jgi:hypothetical protein
VRLTAGIDVEARDISSDESWSQMNASVTGGLLVMTVREAGAGCAGAVEEA